MVPLLESAGKELELSKSVTINLVSQLTDQSSSEWFKIRAIKCLINNIACLGHLDQNQLNDLRTKLKEASDKQWDLLQEIIKWDKEPKNLREKAIGRWSTMTLYRNGKVKDNPEFDKWYITKDQKVAICHKSNFIKE